jgi:hypothetical protein
MARNVYRSAQGKAVNMDTLRLLNEKETAVGNMNVNARGDEISTDGTVVRSRQDIMKDHYSSIKPATDKSNRKK